MFTLPVSKYTERKLIGEKASRICCARTKRVLNFERPIFS
jgi:hypothetical protein